MTAENTLSFHVFPWSNNFNTGIDLIDEQHQRLVELLNELASHLVRNDDIQLERIFTELSDYADFHFQSEEEIWSSYFHDDDWLANHRKTHASFMPRIVELRDAEPDKPFKRTVEDVLKFLIHWLAYHILDTDKRMALALQAIEDGHDTEKAKALANDEMSGSVKMLIDTVLNMYDSLSSRTLDLMREQAERRKAEENLRIAHDNLEHMVKERTAELRCEIIEHQKTAAELRRAMEEAEAANRAKTDFLANMSHELRTPLNAIIGFSDFIKDAMVGPLPDVYQGYGRDINAAGEHLLGIISDILDVSMAEIGELRISPADVHLHHIAGTCDSILRTRAINAGVGMIFDIASDLPMLHVDALRVQQVLLNLLNNALKYTPSGGSVKVAAQTDSEGGLTITVTDTGEGIAPGNIAKALEKFGQIRKGHVYAHEGPGLGLPIANALMELHGGTLTVDSVSGEGTTVTLQFPKERVVQA